MEISDHFSPKALLWFWSQMSGCHGEETTKWRDDLVHRYCFLHGLERSSSSHRWIKVSSACDWTRRGGGEANWRVRHLWRRDAQIGIIRSSRPVLTLTRRDDDENLGLFGGLSFHEKAPPFFSFFLEINLGEGRSRILPNLICFDDIFPWAPRPSANCLIQK